jgi:hydrogenase nickel incorporation protein HypA/HybF
MHEASLAYSILETVTRQCQASNFSRILEVRLRIGQGSGVQPDSLKFAFDICKKNTLAHDAEMTIEIVPLGGECRACGQHFEVENSIIFSCPYCRSSNFSITQGFETQILDMEVE